MSPQRFPTTHLVQRYLGVKLRRGATRGHLDAMSRVLYNFARAVPANPRSINRAHVERFLERPDLAPATIRQYLSIVRNFTKWATIEGHMRRDPALGVEPIEQPPSIPGALSRQKAERLHKSFGELEPRTRLMIALELNDGLRRVELARAQVGDIDLRAASMKVRGKAKGGRGQITHVVALSAQTVELLRAYLANEPSVLGIPALASGPLFRNRNRPREGLTREYIGDLVRNALYDLGIKEAPRDGVSGHSLRHTAATEALEGGVPLAIVQRQLGHASEATTAIYTKGAVLDLRKFHERHNQ